MQNLKKVLIGVLAISLLSGCSPEEEKIDYESFINEGATYLETVEKEITLNEKKHTLAFVYSKDNLASESIETYSITVLFDGKVISESLNNLDISKYSLKNEFKLNDSNINTIKDKDDNIEYLVLNIVTDNDYHCISGCASNAMKIYIIDENGKVLLEDGVSNRFYTITGDENSTDFVDISDLLKFEDKTVTLLKCPALYKYSVTNGEIQRILKKHEENTVLTNSGSWC